MVQLNYEQKHIHKNEFSRPGFELLRLQAIVVHYPANPGADALDHHEYFDDTIIEIGRYAGAHIFTDRFRALELIPLNEGSFGANDGGNASLKIPALRASDSRYPTRTGDGNANLLTIHIEMCQEADGSIHPDTIERTRLVIKMLQERFPQLQDTKNRVVRHFDVTGKLCPRPFVEDDKRWQAFLESIDKPEKEAFQLAESVKVKDVNKLSTWAERSWKELVKNGYLDGTRPGADLTREEFSVVLNRLRTNFLKLISRNNVELKQLKAELEKIESDVDELK